ncbi:MAG: hypothetical protein J6C50_04230 [Rickettsiales bacterium]|nr:hypothetical protein [Rickettsiales bacterium]
METSDEILNNFMVNKNKEALGEKVEKEAEINDNFLGEVDKAMNTFTGESPSNNDNGLLAARKALSAFLTIPIVMGGLFSAFYIVLKLGPSVLNFIRKLFLRMWL